MDDYKCTMDDYKCRMYDYKCQLKQYLNMYYSDNLDETIGFMGNGKTIYYNLFKFPVERIFYCEDESYSGDVLVIFKYNNIYIVGYGNFGSCEICDMWEGIKTLHELRHSIENVFSRLQYYDSVDCIEYDFCSEYIIDKFDEFKIMNKK